MRDLADTYRTIAYAPSKDADIKRENANIDGESSMGAMLKYGSEGAKAFNLDEVLPDEFSKAHQDGYIHIHDLDFYTLTETCCQIDAGRLLAKGFFTGHGFIRPPSNVKTAANLICIIIQSNQNDQHGGQSIPMLDFALAPYVRRSFVKNWRMECEEMLVFRYGYDGDEAKHMAEQWSVKADPTLGGGFQPIEETSPSVLKHISERAEARTRDDVYQAMEALVHNLNTMQSRAGSQVPFSSVNYGTDTSPEGRLVSEMIMRATDAGLGDGETPIFPVQIFKLKDGVNFKPGDPNYDLFKLSVKVSAKRLYPNWESLDAPYNLQYYRAGDPDTEVATMGCYDGNQVVTFRVGGRLFVEGAERFFDKMAMFHEVRGYMKTDWIDVEGKGVEVYDSNANGFVGVKKLIRNPAPDDARLVKFDHGRSIVLTPDHMLPVEGKGRTAVRDLAVGDQVEGVWTQYSEVTQSVDHDTAWLLGLLLCDGCYATSVVVSLGLDETDVRDKVLRVSKANGWENRVKEYDRGPKGRYMDVHITTGSFKAIAKKLSFLFGGERKADRCIPSDVFCWPKEAKYAFLAGMMDADGCVRIHNEKTWYLNLGSVNEELAIQQMLLFQSLGVKAKIVRNHYKNVNAGAIRFAVYVNSTPELTQGLLRHMACKKKTDRMVNYEPMQDRTPFHLCTVESISKHRMSGWCYDIETESDRFDVSGIRSHNCRTRVMGNVWDPSRETTSGRGNLSFTTINLPRLGIEAKGDLDKFFHSLDSMLDLCRRQLLHRLSIQKARRVRNYPFLMGEGVWLDSEKLDWDAPVGDILKHGTLSIGFIGLAECLTALIGNHHGETAEARELGLRIVTHMRHWLDRRSREEKLNYTLLATPAEGLCLAKGSVVQGVYGNKPIEEVKAGDLLYSFNEEKGVVEIDKVEKCWMTSKARKVLKITFDTGQELVCTPNHPLARRVVNQDELGRFVPVDGHNERMEWIEAGDVKPGMRIKSNYITESENGYDKVSGSGERFVHKLVYEYFSGEEVPKGYVVHHKDGDKKNNVFDNFELMTDAAHRAHHLPDTIKPYSYTSEGMMGEKNPFYGRHHTAESKAKMSETLCALRKGKHPHNYIETPGILEKYNAGVPVSELQKQYGFASISAVYARLKSLGVVFASGAGYNTSKVPAEDLISRYYKGMSVKQIASELGLSYATTHQRLKRYGVLQPNHIVVKVEELEEPMEVWDITMSKNHSFYVGGDQGILVHNSGRFVKMDKKKYGEIAGVTDRDYYTNSFHIPVWFNIPAFKKIDIEAPYHNLCNAGHITYIELDGDTARNLDAMETIVRYMHDKGCGYFAISHPVDRDPVCGYVGVIGNVCPRCGRRDGEAISEERLDEIRRKYKVRGAQ